MSDLDILNGQISDQLEGRVRRAVKMRRAYPLRKNVYGETGKTLDYVNVSLFSQEGKYWAKSEEGLSRPVEIAEEVYNKLLRMDEYDGCSWEFESQYLGIHGFEWTRIKR